MSDTKKIKNKNISSIDEFYKRYTPSYYKQYTKKVENPNLEEEEFIKDLTSDFMKEIKNKLDKLGSNSDCQ